MKKTGIQECLNAFFSDLTVNEMLKTFMILLNSV